MNSNFVTYMHIFPLKCKSFQVITFLSVTKLSSFNIFSSWTSLTVGLLHKIIKYYAQWVLNTPGVTQHLWDCRGVNHCDERFSDATYCLCSYYMPSFLWIPPLTKNMSQIIHWAAVILFWPGLPWAFPKPTKGGGRESVDSDWCTFT